MERERVHCWGSDSVFSSILICCFSPYRGNFLFWILYLGEKCCVALVSRGKTRMMNVIGTCSPLWLSVSLLRSYSSRVLSSPSPPSCADHQTLTLSERPELLSRMMLLHLSKIARRQGKSWRSKNDALVDENAHRSLSLSILSWCAQLRNNVASVLDCVYHECTDLSEAFRSLFIRPVDWQRNIGVRSHECTDLSETFSSLFIRQLDYAHK